VAQSAEREAEEKNQEEEEKAKAIEEYSNGKDPNSMNNRLFSFYELN
jgi:hypothetical protein